MLSLYLFIPINIKVFGSEAFGVISYATTIQAILSLLDLGISTVLKREFVVETRGVIRHRLLSTVEGGYTVLLMSILLGGALLIPVVAPVLIRSTSIPTEELSACLFLILVGAIVQVLFMVYQGALWGMGKINQSNGLQVLLSIFKNGIAISVAWALGASLFAFFAFQLLTIAVFAAWSRILIYKNLDHARDSLLPYIDLRLLKTKLSFAGGVFLISVLAAINTQTDKIILSTKLSVDIFAAYSVAFTLSQMPVVVVSPMLNVFFPKLAHLTESKERIHLQHLVRDVSMPAFFLAANVACAMFFYRKTLLSNWLSKPDMIETIASLLPFLLVGGVLQSFTIIPYMLSLAAKDTRTILSVQLVTLMLSLPTSITLINYWGVMGAALTWCIINCIISPPYVIWVMKKNVGTWDAGRYMRQFGLVLMITLANFTLWHYLTNTWKQADLLTGLLLIVGSSVGAYVSTLILLPDFSHKKVVSLFIR